jgi:hypothetical protein
VRSQTKRAKRGGFCPLEVVRQVRRDGPDELDSRLAAMAQQSRQDVDGHREAIEDR